MINFTEPTRSAALHQLEQFLPLVSKYATARNFDLGRQRHTGVSRLSPYIRTRLITEEEVTRAVLERHSPRAAEKFLHEIAWRTYWKGWLEMRPEVWRHYLTSLADQPMGENYHAAVSQKTGIECFDHWTNELVETGYLHNHARMWYASIWIFTLNLPWQLGAEFFLKHLLDGDPASNTLSWRWVAGLHTRGKHYLARAANIEKFTNGRFNPVGQLNEEAPPLDSDMNYEKTELALPPHPQPHGRTGHLMLADDLAPPPEDIGEIHASAAYLPESLKTTPLVTAFLDGAITDSLERSNGTRLDGAFATNLSDWIQNEKLDSIVVSKPTVGPVKDFLKSQSWPIEPRVFVRNWDRLLWPRATAGFFKLKKFLPEVHASFTRSNRNDLFPDI